MSIFQSRAVFVSCMAAAALVCAPAARADDVKVCAFPASPTRALDQQVTKAVFKDLGLSAQIVAFRAGNSDDPVSGFRITGVLKSTCDLFAGMPVSTTDSLKPADLAVSAPYADASFVTFRIDGRPAAVAPELVAVTFESPAQIIAEQQKARQDVENTDSDVIRAVVGGRVAAGITWYPLLVDYQRQHPGTRFTVTRTANDLSDWHLTFVAAPRNAALIERISGSLARLRQTGALDRLAAPWQLPASHSRAESTAAVAVRSADAAGLRFHIALVSHDGPAGGHAAPFSKQQVSDGAKLYATDCAKCHGAKLEGNVGPALRGGGFQPASNSPVTIGGLYQYMTTNMPADKPGQLKPQEYADILAYLLHENGYSPNGKKLTNDAAENIQTSFNSYVK
ncbi:MAG: c-type cytochrome [Proteobacteria bacterium]|nr:c-type cytochrome [Pseudomonadota bacterium]